MKGLLGGLFSLVVAGLLAAPAPAAVGDLGAERQFSQQGGSTLWARDPAIAANPERNEYLAVWQGEATEGETEIFARRLGPDGVPIGGPFQISSMGTAGDSSFDAFEPDVVYNPVSNEYLVAWYASYGTGSFPLDGFEIFVQRLTDLGAQTGTDDLQISATGPANDDDYDARDPAIAHNASANQYLVAWSGALLADTGAGNAGYEIHVERLSATGGTLTDDKQVSTTGAGGDADSNASEPAVTHNPATNEYLATWDSDAETEGKDEVYVQRISAAAAEVGGDQKISATPGGTTAEATNPALAFNPTAGEYLAAWGADPNGGVAQVFVQRLSGTAAQLGSATDQQISDMNFAANSPEVDFDATGNEYLVAWQGEESDNDDRIYAQRLTGPAAAEVGVNDRQLSAAGVAALEPALAHNATAGEFVAAWWAGLPGSGFEVYGRSIEGGGSAPPVVDPTKCAEAQDALAAAKKKLKKAKKKLKKAKKKLKKVKKKGSAKKVKKAKKKVKKAKKAKKKRTKQMRAAKVAAEEACP